VLEAMKMNTHIPANRAGTVAEVLVKVGDAVEEGQALVSLS
jgi:biotin carboxyl carrier protein